MRNQLVGFLMIVLIGGSPCVGAAADDAAEWTNDFSAEKDELSSTGRNTFFIWSPVISSCWRTAKSDLLFRS